MLLQMYKLTMRFCSCLLDAIIRLFRLRSRTKFRFFLLSLASLFSRLVLFSKDCYQSKVVVERAKFHDGKVKGESGVLP